MSIKTLPIPPHFDATKVSQVWRVPYMERAAEAQEYAKAYDVKPAALDRLKVCLMPIDCQNTFCIPGFELFVRGRSGNGAVEDNVRLCEFIYRNLNVITEIDPTMDTHTAMQIFHPIFLVNDKGEHPAPYTLISDDDIKNSVWRVNPAIAHSVANNNYIGLQKHLAHYARKLKSGNKYKLTIWPYHAMLGGIGHALVSSVEEVIFFHNIARYSQTGFEIKGGHPLIENYSVLRPEVLDTYNDQVIAQKNAKLIKKLFEFDVIIAPGQAKSHCFAWTIDDLLNEIAQQDPKLAQKIYLLEDCTSPVVVPNIIDYTDDANAAFQRFADAGMHIVKSTDPIETWPGINL